MSATKPEALAEREQSAAESARAVEPSSATPEPVATAVEAAGATVDPTDVGDTAGQPADVEPADAGAAAAGAEPSDAGADAETSAAVKIQAARRGAVVRKERRAAPAASKAPQASASGDRGAAPAASRAKSSQEVKLSMLCCDLMKEVEQSNADAKRYRQQAADQASALAEAERGRLAARDELGEMAAEVMYLRSECGRMRRQLVAREHTQREVGDVRWQRIEEAGLAAKVVELKRKLKAASYGGGKNSHVDARRLFNRYDRAGNGQLTPADFALGTRRDAQLAADTFGVDSQRALTKRQLKEIFALVDRSESGSISCEEFVLWLHDEPRQKAAAQLPPIVVVKSDAATIHQAIIDGSAATEEAQRYKQRRARKDRKSKQRSPTGRTKQLHAAPMRIVRAPFDTTQRGSEGENRMRRRFGGRATPSGKETQSLPEIDPYMEHSRQ